MKKIILTDIEIYHYWSLIKGGNLAQQFNGSKLKKRDSEFIDWVQEQIREYSGAIWSFDQNAYVSLASQKQD